MDRHSRATEEVIEFCMQHVGRSRPGWKMVVPLGVARTEMSADRLWDVLNDVEGWPKWSPLHAAASWEEGNSLSVGARFKQELDLGFPIGRSTAIATLAFAEPGKRAGWVGEDGGVRSCHLWAFAATADGATEVINGEALCGLSIGLVKPLVASRWRDRFQGAVDGLIATAKAGK